MTTNIEDASPSHVDENSVFLGRPVIIIGAARSGTTMLGKLIGSHPEVAFWSEPLHIWKWSRGKENFDDFPAAWADDLTINTIREKFKEYLDRSGKTRFAEKTPSNSLRLEYVHRILPEAVYVRLVRDGRNVVVSATKSWGGSNVHISKKINNNNHERRTASNVPRVYRTLRRKLQSPPAINDWPYYSGRALKFILRNLGFKTDKVWGPNFPELQASIKEGNILQACALQWKRCVSDESKFFVSNPGVPVLTVKYEDLCLNCDETMAEIYDFLQLRPYDISRSNREAIFIDEPEAWKKKLSYNEAEFLDKFLCEELSFFGYKL